MNITRRVAKLELVRSSIPHHCPDCGYPGRARLRIFMTRDDRCQPKCPTCQYPLDYQGFPLHIPFIRVDRGVQPANWDDLIAQRRLRMEGCG
jgi:hypothetical protein